MTSWYRDIVSYSYITVCASTNLNFLILRLWTSHLFCIHDVEYFGTLTLKWFKYYKILFWYIHLNNINNSIIVGNFEWKIHLAKLTIKLFKLYNDLLLVHFSRAFCLQPTSQTFQMDVTHRACTSTWRDQRIYIICVIWISFIVFRTPTNTTNSFWIGLVCHPVEIVLSHLCHLKFAELTWGNVRVWTFTSLKCLVSLNFFKLNFIQIYSWVASFICNFWACWLT
jgi:hypothetical protein